MYYGPELISHVLVKWAKMNQIEISYIQPGKSQQNVYIERYNRTVPYDWLNQYYFESIDEVQNFETRWMWTYNYERPNMGSGGITPKQKLAVAVPVSTFNLGKNGGITVVLYTEYSSLMPFFTSSCLYAHLPQRSS